MGMKGKRDYKNGILYDSNLQKDKDVMKEELKKKK